MLGQSWRWCEVHDAVDKLIWGAAIRYQSNPNGTLRKRQYVANRFGMAKVDRQSSVVSL